jgi:glycosyltransferase involved in cell wall biosynthesis
MNVECRFCGKFLVGSDSKRNATPEEAKADFFSKVHRYGLEKNVFWKGVVEKDRKWKELEQAHFFILPTSYNNEGQPISIIEALSFGCVVISSNYRTIPDMLDYGNAGVLLNSIHSEEIAAEVKRLIENPGRFRTLSKAAYQRYKHKFTREEHLRNLMDVIRGG